MPPEVEPAQPATPVDDLSTRQGIERFTALWLAKTTEDFNRRGRVKHHAVVFAAQTIDGRPFDSVAAIVILDTDNRMAETVQSKNRFQASIREVCKRTKAVGVMLVIEAWFRRDASQEEIDRANRIGLGKDPKREECVLLTVDHLALERSVMWIGRITRDEKGVGTIAGFEPMGTPDEYEGRFSALFPRELYS